MKEALERIEREAYAQWRNSDSVKMAIDWMGNAGVMSREDHLYANWQKSKLYEEIQIAKVIYEAL